METQCPYCGKRYRADKQNIGTVWRCEKCQQEFQITRENLHRAPLKKSRTVKIIVVALFVILGGTALFPVVQKYISARQIAIAKTKQQQLDVEQKLKEEKKEAEKEKQRIAAEKIAQQRQREAEKAVKENQKCLEENNRARKAEFQKKLDDLDAETQRQVEILMQKEKDAIPQIEQSFSDSQKARDFRMEQEIQAIHDEEKIVGERLEKIIDGKDSLPQLIKEVEKLPPVFQTAAGRIILARCILSRKTYPHASLREIAQTDFKTDERVYIVCPQCRGTGKLHCVTCKDTRVCQQCHGSGSRQTKILRNNQFVFESISCPKECQLCAGKSCRTCSGTTKVISPQLKNRIAEMITEIWVKKREYYPAQIAGIKDKYAKAEKSAKAEMAKKIAKIKADTVAKTAKIKAENAQKGATMKADFAAVVIRENLKYRFKIAEQSQIIQGNLPPELIYYHGTLSSQEWNVLSQLPEIRDQSEASRYHSLTTEVKLKKAMQEKLEEEREEWKTSIDFYQQKRDKLHTVTIRGIIQKKTNDDWYIFTSGGEVGALKLVDDEEYTTTGRFTRLCFPTGKQKFSTTSGGTRELPTFTALGLRDKGFIKINHGMIKSSKENFDLCTRKIEKLTFKDIKREDWLRQMAKRQLPTVDLAFDHVKYIVDNDQVIDLILLIKKGLDINKIYQNDSEKWTILMYAAKKHRNDIVKLLLQYHAYLDALGEIKCPDLSPVSALGVAVFYSNEEAIDLLLQSGADIHNGCSPYLLAWNGENGVRSTDFTIKIWELLNQLKGDANYIDSPFKDHFILEILEDASVDVKLLQYLLNNCHVNPWRCRYNEYDVPSFSETAFKVMMRSPYRLR